MWSDPHDLVHIWFDLVHMNGVRCELPIFGWLKGDSGRGGGQDAKRASPLSLEVIFARYGSIRRGQERNLAHAVVSPPVHVFRHCEFYLTDN